MKQLISLNREHFSGKLKSVLVVLSLIIGASLFTSCDNDLDIQSDFPFEVNVMPVPNQVANGQTVEIRFTIVRNGNYEGTNYFIRYFQFDGQGTLRLYNSFPYLPNDLYPLPAEQFRLYYTSHSNESESFDVWISDNFGNEKKISFQFNNSSN